MENKKERRKAIRIPIISESCKWKLTDGVETFESNLGDFSQKGCFIQSAKPIAPGSYIKAFFNLPGDLGSVPVEGRVTWAKWAKRKADKGELGFGVEFIDVPEHIDKILNAYQTYLRNKQIIAVSKRIIEEFFGKVPPTVKR